MALGERDAGFRALPGDLAAAGLGTGASARFGLQLYASLTAEQLVKARSEAGLPYADMTIYQRHLIGQMARRLAPPAPREVVEKTSFRMTEKTDRRTAQGQTWVITIVRFTVPFGDRPREEMALLRRLEKK